MKEHQQYDKNENESNREFRWWHSTATSEEIASLKITGAGAGDVSSPAALTPRMKVLRELERLAMVAPEAIDDLRHRLVAYRAGDMWVPMGGVKKEEMEVPTVVTILLVGFVGGGKSSLINLMYSVLGRAGIIPFAQTSPGGSSSPHCESTTMSLEEHNVLRSMRAGFCVYDSRGFNYKDEARQSRLTEVSKWMSDGVRHNQLSWRPGDDESINMDMMRCSSNKFVKRQVNCAMVVVNMAQLSKGLKAGDSKVLEATKDVYCSPALKRGNQNPILILTHGDKLSAEERIDARVKICGFLGISETSGVYDIVCLTEYGVIAEEYDPVTAYSITEAVYRALLISDMSYLPKQNYKDTAFFLLSWLLFLLSTFFAFLARVFSSLSLRHNKFKS